MTSFPVLTGTAHRIDSEVRATPTISLRQTRLTHPQGVEVLRIDLQVVGSKHTYTLGIYQGYTGGGKDADGLRPRLREESSTPKVWDAASEALEDLWPPLPALERRIDGVVWPYDYFPETALAHRLERAFYAVEPMLHTIANLRSMKVPGAADQPLINCVKNTLAKF